MHQQCFRVYRILFFAILAIAGALPLLGSQAHAASWMAFDQSSGGAVSRDTLNPTVLNQVTVVCPSTGYRLATGTANAFLRNLPGGIKSQAFVAFSISLEVKRDPFNSTVVLQNMEPDTLANIPASLQRVDACNAGETLTYYHIAYGAGGPAEIQVATEGDSKLVVQFFNRGL